MISLKQLIDSYEPSDDAAESVRSSRVAVLVGITGAGKDTVKKELLALDDYQEIISHTTRPPRKNAGVAEIDGQDYHFVDIKVAENMLREKKFIEAKLVHGTTVYGTSVAELVRASQNNKIAITDVDVQGVAEYKQLSQDIVALFIIPPDHESWLQRLKARYASEAEFIGEWPKRRESAIKELEYALSVPYFHFVLNDDLSRAVRVSDEIIKRGDSYLRQDDETRLLARELLESIKEKP